MQHITPVDIPPEVLTELALGQEPPAQILRRAGLSEAAIKRLLNDPLLKQRVENERRALESSDDLDTYHNRVCYRLLRNRMVALALAGKMNPGDILKAVDMLRRHAGLDKQDSAPAGVAQATPVLNIIVNNPPPSVSPSPAITITPETDALPADPPAHVRLSFPAIVDDLTDGA